MILIVLFSLIINSSLCQRPVMDFIKIDATSFSMGGYIECNEQPVHQVILKGYSISKYEVTVAQYRAYCEATNRRMPHQPGWSKGDNWPVVMVSWKEASDFADWMGGRLPTEAEWEYAARGEKDIKLFTIFSGSDTAGIVSWNGDNSDNAAHAAGTKRPNGFGLYDMNGNVQEWCSDWYSGSYYKISPAENPAGPVSGFHRVVRGGSWFTKPKNLYVALRYNIGPGYRYDDLGFRVVKNN